jgi:hypothetical protein
MFDKERRAFDHLKLENARKENIEGRFGFYYLPVCDILPFYN